ncbi:MAG: ferrous iron transport protein A [Firmicutes bacterium]|nr:ferrous iron transport protein A [Bacillota bacterium]MDH7496383.1 FeoA family protein [Bacillota bacterium]
MGGNTRLISLVNARAGETVQVVEILGGHGLVARLEALGIRQGAELRKVSSLFLRGPVTVEVHDTKVAMGYGMASKVLVRPIDRAGEGSGAGGTDDANQSSHNANQSSQASQGSHPLQDRQGGRAPDSNGCGSLPRGCGSREQARQGKRAALPKSTDEEHGASSSSGVRAMARDAKAALRPGGEGA